MLHKQLTLLNLGSHTLCTRMFLHLVLVHYQFIFFSFSIVLHRCISSVGRSGRGEGIHSEVVDVVQCNTLRWFDHLKRVG